MIQSAIGEALNRHAEAAKRDDFMEATAARVDIIRLYREQVSYVEQLKQFVEYAAGFTGQGGGDFTFQEIVRDLGAKARAALAKNPTELSTTRREDEQADASSARSAATPAATEGPGTNSKSEIDQLAELLRIIRAHPGSNVADCLRGDKTLANLIDAALAKNQRPGASEEPANGASGSTPHGKWGSTPSPVPTLPMTEIGRDPERCPHGQRLYLRCVKCEADSENGVGTEPK